MNVTWTDDQLKAFINEAASFSDDRDTVIRLADDGTGIGNNNETETIAQIYLVVPAGDYLSRDWPVCG